MSALGFPTIPGVTDPATAEAPGQMRNDRFTPLPFLVSRVDADGNDTAGIRVPEQSVPLATTTGWNFRSPRVGNPATIYALVGSYIPLPVTRAEQQRRGDPRASVEERYASREAYVQKIRTAAAALIHDRYLLQEDMDSIVARANAHWDYAHRAPTTTSARR